MNHTKITFQPSPTQNQLMLSEAALALADCNIHKTGCMIQLLTKYLDFAEDSFTGLQHFSYSLAKEKVTLQMHSENEAPTTIVFTLLNNQWQASCNLYDATIQFTPIQQAGITEIVYTTLLTIQAIAATDEAATSQPPPLDPIAVVPSVPTPNKPKPSASTGAQAPHYSSSPSAASIQYPPHLQDLIHKHAEQLKQFETWAANAQWQQFATAHYDWWSLPITRPSAGYNNRYTVQSAEAELLRQDPIFMQDYRRTIQLIGLSWGYDLQLGCPAIFPDPQQKWTGYYIRLAKMACSLRLFKEATLLQNVQTFARKHTNFQTDLACEPWMREELTKPIT